MICGKCGRNIENESICRFCGNGNEENGFENKIPVYGVSAPRQMRWYMFLIYFSLYFSAFSAVMSAVMYFVGNYWDYYADMIPGVGNIYQQYVSIRYIDILMGIIQIGIGVYSVLVRNSLAGFKKRGPFMLYVLYGVNQLVSTGYTVAVNCIISGSADYAMVVFNVIVTAIIIWINVIYFGKRADMFVG